MKDFNILTIQTAIIHWLSMIRYKCCYIDISRERTVESTKKHILVKKLLFSIYDLGSQIYCRYEMSVPQVIIENSKISNLLAVVIHRINRASPVWQCCVSTVDEMSTRQSKLLSNMQEVSYETL